MQCRVPSLLGGRVRGVPLVPWRAVGGGGRGTVSGFVSAGSCVGHRPPPSALRPTVRCFWDNVAPWERQGEQGVLHTKRLRSLEELSGVRMGGKDPAWIEQMLLEEKAQVLASQKKRDLQRDLVELGKASCLRPVENLLLQWFPPLRAALEQEQQNISEGSSGTPLSHLHGGFMLQLSPDQLAVIGLHAVIGALLKSPMGVPYVRVAIDIGRVVQAQVNLQKMSKDKRLLRSLPASHHHNVHKINLHAKWYIQESDWSNKVHSYLGGTIIFFILENAKLLEDDSRAIYHELMPHNGKQVGMIKGSEAFFQQIEKGFSLPAFDVHYAPMIVRPENWIRSDTGGYLSESHKIVRTKEGSLTQLERIKAQENKKLEDIFKATNALSQTSWKINGAVYAIMLKAWENGGNTGGLPPADNVQSLPGPTDPNNSREYKTVKKKVDQENAERHSLRCDLRLKLGVAEEFSQHPQFFFPHNLDFRGRAYPIPPHLNHLGSDLSRGLLLFAEGKPLGNRGLEWMKIHIANLHGQNKVSFADRVKFTDNSMAEIYDSADRPLEGNKWWLNADYPWQCLSACMEMVNALRSGKPEDFVSYLPIHQDGTCNGLQHYAALGGDILGAKEVNLIPASVPQDVYNGVAQLVRKRVEEDARVGDPIAIQLLGKVDRKMIKQTVMTSVYGVTFVGARKQIENAMKDKKLVFQGDVNPLKASTYMAKHVFSSLGEMFLGARQIMDWLATCAHEIAKSGKPVEWMSPLGLPIVQPYKKQNGSREFVKTLVQTVCLSPNPDNLPVNIARQKSAFPPNYIHSLDSAHMMKTAIRMQEAGLTYASVHDSFWTHAASVDEMNVELRDAFVDLHSQPLLEQLLDFMKQQNPGVKFPPLPKRGDLDLTVVRDSQYFFN